MEQEKVFTNGFIFKEKPNAPDFVKLGVSCIAKEAAQWLLDNADEKGWVNFDIKKSKSEKLYGEKDNWKPTPKTETKEEVSEDLPF